MPYYVFRLGQAAGDKKAGLEQEFDGYKDAKACVVQLRRDHPDEDVNNFRLIFAENVQKARILLTTPRERPPVEEWES